VSKTKTTLQSPGHIDGVNNTNRTRENGELTLDGTASGGLGGRGLDRRRATVVVATATTTATTVFVGGSRGGGGGGGGKFGVFIISGIIFRYFLSVMLRMYVLRARVPPICLLNQNNQYAL
jgi:hypothetical protein